MKKLKFSSLLLTGLCLSGSLLFSSCDKEPTSTQDPVAPTLPGAKGPYEHGVFVINEGNTLGAISYYNPAGKVVKKDIFQDENKRPVGQFLQSMAVHNDKAYLVAGGSKKLEIVDANTFKSVGIISGLEIPRYFIVSGTKGYLTDYVTYSGNGQVAVIDLNTNTVTKTIPVGKLPELMAIVENKLYVTNSADNFISVINLTTETAEAPITVGQGPSSIVVDANKKLWVLCGSSYGTDPGSLAQVDPATGTVEKNFPIQAKSASPQDLTINGQKNRLYFTLDNKIFSMGISDAALPSTPLVDRGTKGFYGLGVDPQENIIYGAYAPDFSSEGKVIRYNPGGAAIDSFNVSVGPNGFLFK